MTIEESISDPAIRAKWRATEERIRRMVELQRNPEYWARMNELRGIVGAKPFTEEQIAEFCRH